MRFDDTQIHKIMKQFLTLALALVFSATLFADGIQFEEGSWSDILSKAKKENKIVFVDAYTTWCGPCKWMAANAFPDKAVGDYFNSTFINAKIDMEKGEGIEIARKYAVRAYPTLLFVNGDGELVHRAIGARDAKGLLDLGKTANDPDKQIITLVKKYEAGDRDPAFLLKFANVAKDAGLSNAKEIGNAYLKTQTDLLTTDNIKFIFSNTYSSKDEYFDFMMKNKDKFSTVVGKDKFDGRLKSSVLRPMYRQEGINFDDVNKALNKVFDADDAAKYTAEFKMNYYAYRLKSDDFKPKYFEAAQAFLDTYGSDNQQLLNSVAWTFYENTTDKKLLKKACKWAEKSVKIDSNFYNNDTVAAICHQLGKKRKARKYAKRAIKLGKADGADVSATEDLLEKINAL
jgi:thiol-disulfide isomerase/thioredoxin